MWLRYVSDCGGKRWGGGGGGGHDVCIALGF